MYGPSVSAPHLAQYGIFASNARGPGLITRSYASNMADAAYYVGACQRECNTLLAFDRAPTPCWATLAPTQAGTW
jgi:hypothetical protein